MPSLLVKAFVIDFGVDFDCTFIEDDLDRLVVVGRRLGGVDLEGKSLISSL